MTIVMLDMMVPGSLIVQCSALATGDVVDQVCSQTLGSFDGSELAASIFRLDGANGVGGIIAQCVPRTPIPIVRALSTRGIIVLTAAGRIGITIGYGRIVEPAGRQYAIVVDGPGRYAAAYDSGSVAYSYGSIL